MTNTTIAFAELPELGSPLDGGIFAGIITKMGGTHWAIVLLPDHGTSLTWNEALNWTKKLEAVLPNRPVAAMIFANLKDRLHPSWHWTCEEDDASHAWYCGFYTGDQYINHKSDDGSAVAVRYLPITEALPSPADKEDTSSNAVTLKAILAKQTEISEMLLQLPSFIPRATTKRRSLTRG